MIDQELDIRTADGTMNTFITYPEEGGPYPVVLFYMDAPGKREELHDMARRIASVGYYVVLPNLYYRRTREFVMVRDEEGFKRMFDMMGHLSIDLVERDTQAMLDFIDRQPQAQAGNIGAIGYCMSGQYAISAAARHADRVHCAASLYGVHLADDEGGSDHLRLADVRGELYVACAEVDKYAPPAVVEAFERNVQAAGTRCRVEWYPGAEHGFAFPQRAVYDKPSAERHWERLFALFRRNLSAAG